MLWDVPGNRFGDKRDYFLHNCADQEGNLMAVAERKSKIGENYVRNEERVKDKKYEVDTAPVDKSIRPKPKMIVHTLSSYTLFVPCWVFVRTSFLQTPPKNCDIFRRLHLVYY